MLSHTNSDDLECANDCTKHFNFVSISSFKPLRIFIKLAYYSKFQVRTLRLGEV